MAKWRDIERDERFQSLPYEKKLAVRDQFFKDAILPSLNSREEAQAVYQRFVERTQFPDDKPFKTRLGERVAARGQQAIGGNIAAAARSVKDPGAHRAADDEALAAEAPEDATAMDALGHVARQAGAIARAPFRGINESLSLGFRGEAGEQFLDDAEAVGQGIAESGSINLEEAGEYGYRRPDSIRKAPVQALKYYGSHAVESLIGDMAPSMAMGYLFRRGGAGPAQTAGLGTMGGKVFGEEYHRAFEETGDHAAALETAQVRAVAEVLPETLPFSLALRIGGDLTQRLSKSAITHLAAVGTAEGGSEVLTEAINAAYDQYGLGEHIERDEFVARMKDAFVTGFLMGEGMGIPGAIDIFHQNQHDRAFGGIDEALKDFKRGGYDAMKGRPVEAEPPQLNRPADFNVGPDGTATPNAAYEPEPDEDEGPQRALPGPGPEGSTLYGGEDRAPGFGIDLTAPVGGGRGFVDRTPESGVPHGTPVVPDNEVPAYANVFDEALAEYEAEAAARRPRSPEDIDPEGEPEAYLPEGEIIDPLELDDAAYAKWVDYRRRDFERQHERLERLARPTLLDEIALAHGGLNLEAFRGHGADQGATKFPKDNQRNVGRPIWRRNGGLTPDGLAEVLMELASSSDWTIPADMLDEHGRIDANDAADLALDEWNNPGSRVPSRYQEQLGVLLTELDRELTDTQRARQETADRRAFNAGVFGQPDMQDYPYSDADVETRPMHEPEFYDEGWDAGTRVLADWISHAAEAGVDPEAILAIESNLPDDSVAATQQAVREIAQLIEEKHRRDQEQAEAEATAAAEVPRPDDERAGETEPGDATDATADQAEVADGDLFNQDTATEQALADEQKKKDKARDGDPDKPIVPPEEGPGDLFGQPDTQQGLFEEPEAQAADDEFEAGRWQETDDGVPDDLREITREQFNTLKNNSSAQSLGMGKPKFSKPVKIGRNHYIATGVMHASGKGHVNIVVVVPRSESQHTGKLRVDPMEGGQFSYWNLEATYRGQPWVLRHPFRVDEETLEVTRQRIVDPYKRDEATDSGAADDQAPPSGDSSAPKGEFDLERLRQIRDLMKGGDTFWLIETALSVADPAKRHNYAPKEAARLLDKAATFALQAKRPDVADALTDELERAAIAPLEHVQGKPPVVVRRNLWLRVAALPEKAKLGHDNAEREAEIVDSLSRAKKALHHKLDDKKAHLQAALNLEEAKFLMVEQRDSVGSFGFGYQEIINDIDLALDTLYALNPEFPRNEADEAAASPNAADENSLQEDSDEQDGQQQPSGPERPDAGDGSQLQGEEGQQPQDGDSPGGREGPGLRDEPEGEAPVTPDETDEGAGLPVPESEVVDPDDPLANLLANVAGEPPDRALMIVLRDTLEIATDHDGGLKGEAQTIASGLLKQVEAALEEGGDLAGVRADAVTALKEIEDGADDAETLRAIRKALEAQMQEAGQTPALPEPTKDEKPAPEPERKLPDPGKTLNADVRVSVDNPGGEWLKGKQAANDKAGRRTEFPGNPPVQFGPLTAVIADRSKRFRVPVSMLKEVLGLRGEQKDVRQDSLKWLRENMEVREGQVFIRKGDGWEQYSPFIMVDQTGTPWVSEGNHRIMAAAEQGVDVLEVDVRWFSGGEAVEGPWSPDSLRSLTMPGAGTQTKPPPTKDEKPDPRKNKLKNTGADLRRWWDKLKADSEKAKTDGEKLWNLIYTRTARPRVFQPKPADDATPGVQRYYDAVRSQLVTFANVLERADNMPAVMGWSNDYTLAERIEKIFDPEPHDLSEEQHQKDWRAIVMDMAAAYEAMMGELADHLSGAATIEQAEARLAQFIDTTKLSIGYNPGIEVFDPDNSPIMPFEAGGRPINPWPRQYTLEGRRLALLMMYRGDPSADPRPLRKLSALLKHENEVKDPNKKKRMVRPRQEEPERQSDRKVRDGDVTPEQFKDEFGFADVGFGNWVAAGRDQRHLNAAWDAFADLAHTLGVPRKAMGMFGKLHFTIGALGHGKHAAHFQRSQPHPDGGSVPVINVTNTKGDGTVAHEWGHALDFLVAQPEPNAEWVRDYIVRRLQKSYSFKRVEDAMWAGIKKQSWMTQSGPKGSVENVRALINYRRYNQPSSQFMRDAKQLGNNKYWASEVEMWARAWEAYIFDKLEGTNSYLVDDWVADNEVSKDSGYRGRPYPTGEERQQFAHLFDALLASLKADGDSLTIDKKAFLAALPESVRDFDKRVDALIEAVPEKIKEYEAEQEAEKKKKAQAATEAAAAAWAEAAEQANAELSVDQAAEDLEDEPEPPDHDDPLSDDALSALFDEALDELQEERQEQPDVPQLPEPPSAETAQDEDDGEPAPKKPPKIRKPKDYLGAFAEEGIKGIDETLKGISSLFPPNKLNSFPPNIDRETYEKAKPHFEAALQAFREAGKNLKEFFRLMIENFGAGIKPYLMHFAKEKGLTMSLQERPVEEARPFGVGSLTGFLYSRIDQITDNGVLNRLLTEHLGHAPSELEKKRGQEAYEMALVFHARTLVHRAQQEGRDRRSVFTELLRLYEGQPNLNVRSSTSMENQAYSTPLPLAYLVSELAGIDRGTTVYEPTAGNGALLIGADRRNVRANERNSDRAFNLRALGYLDTTEHDAREWKPGQSFEAVVMNPPFGKHDEVRVDGYRLEAIDHIIAAKALEAMQDDGRAVLIIGAEKDAGKRPSGPKQVFLNWLYAHYNVTDHFEVAGDLYRKQGAGWPVAVITVDGRRKSDRVFDSAVERLDSWSDIYEHAAGVLGSERPSVEAEGGSVGAGEQAGEPGTAQRPTGGAADTAGPGTGRGGRPGDGLAGGARNDARGEPDSGGSERQPGDNRGDTDGVGPSGQPVEDPVDEGRAPGPQSPAPVPDSDVRGTPRHPDNSGLGSDYQVPYQPGSAGFNDSVLVPINMRSALDRAIETLRESVGDIDQYVMRKLGYPSREALYDAFMALQVDAVAAAIWNIENKDRGVIIADQTGVGKGRQGAALMRYALRHNMVPVFLTAKDNLFTDIYENLLDIGETGVEPFIFNAGTGIIDPNTHKVRFRRTPSDRKAGLAALQSGAVPKGANALFLTYSQFQTNNEQRRALRGLVESGLKPLFILDESHNVSGDRIRVVKKKKVMTGAGFMFKLLENQPVVYLSATYAKRADNMPIYYRTDLFDAVDSVEEMVQAIDAGGEALQTVYSNMLAQAGQLWRRERSFEGIDFPTKIYEADTERQVKLTDHVTGGLRAIVDADNAFKEWIEDAGVADIVGPGSSFSHAGSGADIALQHSPFTSIVHNFIKQFLLSMKADLVVEEAIKLHKEGAKPVIALDWTMESFLRAEIERGNAAVGKRWEGDYRSILTAALETTRRVTIKNPQGDDERITVRLDQLDPGVRMIYEQAQRQIDKLPVQDVVLFYIDYIRHKLEKAGIRTSELTGRSLMLDYSKGGAPVVRQRPAEERKNRRRIIDRFNGGELDALIINASGATGLSIHSSETFKDQSKRHMLVAQALGDINLLMQMLGRINRTGQVVVPGYTMMGLNIPAEHRPLAMTARKMRSLNANTSANTESETSIDVTAMFNKYGDQVVNELLLENPEWASTTRVEPIESGTPDAGLAQKFTGRLALAPIAMQREAWEAMFSSYEALIAFLDSTGQNELSTDTIDLGARIVENRVIYEGKNPDALFGGDAVLHKITAKVQGRAPSGAEVVSAVADALDGKPPQVVTSELMAQLEEQDTVTSGLNDMLEDAKKELDRLHGDKEATDKQTTEARVKVARLQERVSQRGEHKESVRRNVSGLRIGDAHKLDLGDDVVTAVIVGIRTTHKGQGDSYAQSKIRVKFMVNSPIRTVELPLSKLMGADMLAPLYGGSSPERVKNLFDATHAAHKPRETRYVVTGNLIAGFSAVAELTKGSKGRVVSFRAANGNQYTGILLPRKFGKDGEFEAASIGNRPLRDPGEAFQYLSAAKNEQPLDQVGLFARGQEVRIYWSRYDGNWKIAVKRRNDAVSNQVKFDDDLRALVGDFAGSGSQMYADVSDAILPDVLKRLSQIITLYAPGSGKHIVAAVRDEDESAERGTRLSFDGGQDDARLSEDFEDSDEGGLFDQNEEPALHRVEAASSPTMSEAIANLATAIGNALGVQLKIPSTVPGRFGEDAQAIQRAFEQALGRKLPKRTVETIPVPKHVAAQVRVLERLFGVKVVFFRDKSGIGAGGVATKEFSRRVYVNVDAKYHLISVAAHEMWHRMERARPDLHRKLRAYLENNADIEKYRAKLAKAHEDLDWDAVKDGPPEWMVWSEIMADLVGETLTDEARLRKLAADDPKTFFGFIEYVLEWLSRMMARLKRQGLGAGRYYRDFKAAQTAAFSILQEFRNASPAPEAARERPQADTPAERAADGVSFSLGEREVAKGVREALGDVRAAWERQADAAIGWFNNTDVGGRLAHYEVLGTLKDREKYLTRRYKTLGVIGKSEALSKRINIAFKKASDKTKAQVFEYMTTPGASPSIIENSAARNNAVKIKKMIDTIGKQLVEAGMLSQEAYEEHRDGYLPRLYLKHLMDENLAWRSLGGGKRTSDLGYLKKRKDIPADVRAVILGEVKDPAFLASVSVGRSLRDMAILDFLDWISGQEDWIHPDSVVEFDGKRVSIFWLSREADRLRRQSKLMKGEPAAKALEIAERMEAVVEATEAVTGKKVEGFTRIPRRPQFGRLAGMYVRHEIYDDLMGVTGYGRQEFSVIESMFGYGGIGTAITQTWKVLKVALNPPTQVRNFISNMILVYLSGVPVHQLPFLFVDAIKQIKQNGRAWQVAKEYGVTQSTFANNELRSLHRELTSLRRANATGRVQHAALTLQTVWEVISGFGSDVYQLMESVGKTMIIMHRLEQGAKPAEAAMEAHKWLFDYSLVPRTVGYVRNAPIGMPFITFYYKALPRMLEVAIRAPWRFLPFVVMPYVITTIMASLNDVDEDDWEALKMALPEWLREHRHAYLVPWRDEHGRWVAFDFSYFLPWTMFTDAARNAAEGEVIEAFRETGAFGGPVADIITALRTNKDPFTGREIINEIDPPQMKAWQLFKYVWSLSMPTFITNQGTAGKLLQATGWDSGASLDDQMRPRYTVSQALIRTFGLNLYPIDPEMTRAQNIERMKYELNQLKRRMRRELGLPNISGDRAARIEAAYLAEIEARTEQMLEYAEASEVHPNLQVKPPE